MKRIDFPGTFNIVTLLKGTNYPIGGMTFNYLIIYLKWEGQAPTRQSQQGFKGFMEIKFVQIDEHKS